jgi:AcrR family transcriptional regulator
VPRRPDTARRAELLDRVIDTIATSGLGARSLRNLADAAGTSHRVVLHHFGSRDELLVAIVGEVERRTATTLSDAASAQAQSNVTDAGVSTRPSKRAQPTTSASPQRSEVLAAQHDAIDVINAVWHHVRQPQLRPFEKLFFECYARGAQGEVPFDRLLPGGITNWLTQASTLPGGHDTAQVRLGLAVLRGLLLDLVATNDDIAVNAAWNRYIDLLRASSAMRARR